MDSDNIQKGKSARLLKGSVGKTLVSLAIPMGLGLAAIFLFNIVDTFYVGQLGAKPLAAMGFTFPVTYIVMSVAMGFSVGASSTISRAIGEGQQDKVRRLTTDVVVLSVLIVTLFAMIGLTSLRRIFTLMGADAETLELISDYMIPWFLGVGLLGIPIVSNGAIRATGDTKSPAIIMAIAGLVNIVLDPFLIFGIGPFPRLELRGAALASVISWSLTFAATIWILGKRERMIGLPFFAAKQSLESWRQI
ncbi:MAG: MATE family efflux transporter, partial [Candidatus Poribacteria bacterium]|nr:MATE family efflux transporter [Candidatus Poribacteria bacterium]